MEEKRIYAGVIYAHINKINGLYYIGQTAREPNVRFGKNGSNYRGCKYFWRAILKYGWDNFEHIILEKIESSNEEELFKSMGERETYYICFYSSLAPKGYNLTTPVAGAPTSDIIKAEISKKNSRKVICLETGEVYDSIKMASNKIGVKPTVVNNCCLGKKLTAKGLHWQYFDDTRKTVEEMEINRKSYVRTEKRARSAEKSVICLETSVIYKSAKSAQDETGIQKNRIGKCCRNKALVAGGFHWQFYNEEARSIEDIECGRKKGIQPVLKTLKPVMCLNNKKIYDSARSAMRDTGTPFYQISDCCRGVRKSINGVCWQFVKDYQKTIEVGV